MTDEIVPLIEIHDPALDGEAIARRVCQRVAQRQAEGAYGPDPAALGIETLRPDRGASATNVVVGFPGLHEALAELIASGDLAESRFTSNMPLLGSFVVVVRRFWNWMSTKWYVRPILSQQSGVNARAARLISELAQWHELDTRRLGELEARVAELEARLARFESETVA
jgi:hypothetical protein